MFVIYGCTIFEEGDEIILVLVCIRLVIQREIRTKGSKIEAKRVRFCFVFFSVELFFFLYIVNQDICFLYIKLEFLLFYLNNAHV